MNCKIHPMSQWIPAPIGYDPYNSLDDSYVLMHGNRTEAKQNLLEAMYARALERKQRG